MSNNITHTTPLNGGLRRVSAIVLVAAAALYTLASIPAEATPIPGIDRPPVVRPPIVRPPRTGIEGARRDKPPKKGCTLPQCEKKLADLEKEFLGSEDGKDAKKKIAELKKIRDRKLKEANEEYIKKQKAKAAKKDDDYACCVYTSEEMKNAHNDMTKEIGDAHKEFDKAKKKIVGDGLKKSNPKKYEKYQKAQAELKEIKKAESKVSEIGSSEPVPGGDMPWDPPAPVQPRVQP